MRNLFFISVALLFAFQSIAQAEIRSEEDWDKVTVTTVFHDVDGLIKGKEISAKTIGRTLNSNRNVLKIKTLEKLKREAAVKGYHMVLLINQRNRSFHRGGKHGVVSTAVGIGYSNN